MKLIVLEAAGPIAIIPLVILRIRSKQTSALCDAQPPVCSATHCLANIAQGASQPTVNITKGQSMKRGTESTWRRLI